MKFSIVIPVYNVEKYLNQCIESVTAQTFQNFEIILVDDGSPDHSGAMCDVWAEKDSRIRAIHQKNGGLSEARNTGIRNAAGDYLLFLDSDDWWADEHVLSQIAQHLDSTNADVLSFNYRKSYNEVIGSPYFPDSLLSSETAEDLEQILRHDRWVTGACNKAIRRNLLTEKDLYFRIGITSEDIDWTLRLALNADTFAFANVCVFIYRQHAASISHSLTPQKTECLCGNVRECVHLLESAETQKAELLKPFVAYQYGTLLYNVANLSDSERSAELMASVHEMKWLLNCSENGKVRLLRLCSRFVGLSGTLLMLQLRQKLLEHRRKGV